MAALSPMPTGQQPPAERRATLDRRKSITFKGKSFYLDLPQNKRTQVLTKAICRLGGVMEGFLSRDINYVVTGNKKALEISNGSSVTGKKGKRQDMENIEPAMSRGKQLLKKAIQNQEHNSVLANAHSWGVCILHVDEVLGYLQHSAHSTSKTAQGKAAFGVRQTVKVGKLKCPFLKIEDRSRRYRPLHCCFSSFPEISFMSSDRSPFEAARTNNGTHREKLSHKEKDAGDQERDGERSQRPNAWEKSGYCECCHVAYTKLREHLTSEQHKKFALDTSNYKVIDDIACHTTWDLMEYPHGIMPVSEGGVGDGLVGVEDARVSVVRDESKMGAPEVPCEETGSLTTTKEDHAKHNVGEEHVLRVACPLPVENVASSELDVTMNDGESVEEKGQRHPVAEDPNHVLIQCKEPLQEICDPGAASHVDVVTEVSWYTEEAGLTSVYTVQSLVIPPDGKHAQLTTTNALATFAQPLLLTPLSDPQGAVDTEHQSEAHKTPVLGNSLPGTHIMNTTAAHCGELLVEQTSLLAIDEQHQELFTEPSAVNFCRVRLLDALVQLPASEKRSEEMIDMQIESTKVHEQQLLSGEHDKPLLNSPTRLHAQLKRTLSQDQLNVIPLFKGPEDALVVTSSTLLLTTNGSGEDQSQLTVTPLVQGLANTPGGRDGSTPLGNHASEPEQNQSNTTPLCKGLAEIAHSTTPLDNEASVSEQNQSNVIPLCKNLADNTEIAPSTTPLGNKASAPEQNQSNAIRLCNGLSVNTEMTYSTTPLSNEASVQNRLDSAPLCQGPAVMHSTRTLADEAEMLEKNPLQSSTDFCKSKRKQSFSSSTPPAKRQAYHYQPMSLPVWVFHQCSDSGHRPVAHGLPNVMEREKGAVAKEVNVDFPRPYFSPKLVQYDASSETDWDLGLLSQQQCKHQQVAQLGELCTAQVNLDESWYGKELCSVLAQDQSLGPLSTSQTVTLAHTSYDLCLSGAAS